MRDGGEVSVDSTGLEAHHASQHYRYRRARDPGVNVDMPDWPKMTWVVDNPSHLIAGVWAGRGPSYDFGTLEPALRQAARHLHAAVLLADSGFDSEHNHRVAREELGFARTLIALNRRGGSAAPRGRYRRQVHRRPGRRLYGQRWQIESTVSQHKRRLGSALRARSRAAQTRECLLRVLVHDLAIVKSS
ncbi:MAG: transposase [Terriglobales bacterium]